MLSENGHYARISAWLDDLCVRYQIRVLKQWQFHSTVLGFHHMQSAYNRDEYVTIHWENVIPGLENQFIKFPNSELTFFNTTYDYHSIMHYGAYYFSENGKPTVVPKVSKPTGNQMEIQILSVI